MPEQDETKLEELKDAYAAADAAYAVAVAAADATYVATADKADDAEWAALIEELKAAYAAADPRAAYKVELKKTQEEAKNDRV